jgi:hypothetical protein
MSRFAISLGAVLLTASMGCASEPAPTPATPNDVRRTEPAPPGRTAGLVLVAVGAHAGVIAVGTSVMMLHEKGVRDDECNPDKACSQDGLQANDRLNKLGPWNAGAWILAGAALGGGIFLVLSNPRKRDAREPRTTTGLTVGPGGAGLKTTF